MDGVDSLVGLAGLISLIPAILFLPIGLYLFFTSKENAFKKAMGIVVTLIGGFFLINGIFTLL